ncbi:MULTISPECIES: universal stress protein [unclassified Streptomyces]|uniref:universal stress protein n=1 Tax=unclassified Streptomyces TaxID=2593676 RepID=UPI000C275407|nr:universal stress protein [Streptomyces sp. CB02959]PJN40790.1 stress protein [Streptomyces sp. CB02959]
MGTLPVIVGVDGSPDSERALRWAADAARARSAPLRIVHVWPYATAERAAAGEQGGDPVLAGLRDRPFLAELPDVEFRGLSGLADTQLPALGAEGQLLVLGSRGRGGFASLLLGSNGLACAARSACPVVVVPRPDRAGTERGPDGEAVPPAVRQVTLGVDASADEPAALDFAFAEAARRGARLRVVSGYTWPMLLPPAFEYAAVYESTQPEYQDALGLRLVDALAPHRVRHPGVEVLVQLRAEDAAGQLVAASTGSDLVVVARHRRRLPVGPRLGSVAHAVLLHAVCPVAVVPETPAEDGGGGGGSEGGGS